MINLRKRIFPQFVFFVLSTVVVVVVGGKPGLSVPVLHWVLVAALPYY
jgi:hypothetical protein